MQKLRALLLKRSSPRLLLAAVFCALVLNGIAFLTHRHSVEQQSGSLGHTELCTYCASFGALGAASADLARTHAPLDLELLVLTFFIAAAPVLRLATSARPRAPPRS